MVFAIIILTTFACNTKHTNNEKLVEEFDEEFIAEETAIEEESTFTGKDSNNHGNYEDEYVDLGLPSGRKWAICNEGASKPEEIGGYYCYATYKYRSSLPTTKDFEELEEKCTWEYMSMENMSGYKIIGPNGNSIFLPAASKEGRSDYMFIFGYYLTRSEANCPSVGEHSVFCFDLLTNTRISQCASDFTSVSIRQIK